METTDKILLGILIGVLVIIILIIINTIVTDNQKTLGCIKLGYEDYDYRDSQPFCEDVRSVKIKNFGRDYIKKVPKEKRGWGVSYGY